MFESTRSLLFVVPLCGAALLGCSATANDPAPGGSTANAGTSSTTGGGGSGGSTTGGVSSGGSTTTTGGVSSGGSTSGGAAGSVGTSGSVGTGGTPPTPPQPVSLALPYTEDWETGTINSIAWLPSDPASLAAFSIVADDTDQALQFSNPGSEVQLVGGDVGWTDIKLELKMQLVSGTPTASIAVRYNTYDTYYFLEVGDGHFKIRDRSNGGSDIQPVADEPVLALGTWYTITVVVQGQNLSASVDGLEIAAGTMAGTPIANGGIGFGCKSTFSGAVLFDDITVSAP